MATYFLTATCVTEATPCLPHPALHLFLTPAPAPTKCNSSSRSFLYFHSLHDTMYLPPQEKEKQAPALSFSYPFFFFFLQELVLMTHMSSRLGTPCSSVRGQGSNQDTPCTSIPVACPFWGAVIYVPYRKTEFRTFGSQPKAVAVLTNFLAVGICVYFGNTLIHFVMTVIV